MIYQLRVEAEAEAESEVAADWYEARTPGLGASFMSSLVKTLDAIAEAPELYARLRIAPAYRRAPMWRFPYSVIFSLEGNMIEVVAVAHGRRQPGYWLR